MTKQDVFDVILFASIMIVVYCLVAIFGQYPSEVVPSTPVAAALPGCRPPRVYIGEPVDVVVVNCGAPSHIYVSTYRGRPTSSQWIYDNGREYDAIYFEDGVVCTFSYSDDSGRLFEGNQ